MCAVYIKTSDVHSESTCVSVRARWLYLQTTGPNIFGSRAHFILSLPSCKPGSTIPQRVWPQIKAPCGTSVIYQSKGCFQQNQVSQRGRPESLVQIESGTFPRGRGVSAVHIPGEVASTLCQELCWVGIPRRKPNLGLKQFPVHGELHNLHWIFTYISSLDSYNSLL